MQGGLLELYRQLYRSGVLRTSGIPRPVTEVGILQCELERLQSAHKIFSPRPFFAFYHTSKT